MINITIEQKVMWLAALTAIPWGFTGIFVRLLPPIPSLTITAGRFAISLITILPILFCFKSTRSSLRNTMSCSVNYTLALLLIGDYVFATTAFQLAPVAEIALLLGTTPLFVLVICCIRGESSTLSEICGALLPIIGIAIIMLPKISFSDSHGIQHLLGDIFAVFAAASVATYAYIYRMLVNKGHAPECIGVSILTFLLGGITLGVIVTLSPHASGITSLNKNDIFIFLGLGIISTAIPTLSFAIASKQLPPIITAMISIFIPLFSGVFAYLILHEYLSILFLVGCIFVLLGVFLIVQKPKLFKIYAKS